MLPVYVQGMPTMIPSTLSALANCNASLAVSIHTLSVLMTYLRRVRDGSVRDEGRMTDAL